MRVNQLINRIIYPIGPEGAAFTNGYAGHGTCVPSHEDIKQLGESWQVAENRKGGASIPGERVKALAR